MTKENLLVFSVIIDMHLLGTDNSTNSQDLSYPLTDIGSILNINLICSINGTIDLPLNE